MFAGALAIAVRLMLLPALPIPVPEVSDEFGYLLGADTFASGRITNPPHPMWVHFETGHVNMQPTYHSKYMPAQSLFLALGRRVFGHPWYGVCLAMGLMFAALCWMLYGWLAPLYAVAATLLAMLEWGFTTYWINSYWGGMVPALGGALVIGAVPRLARRIDIAPLFAGMTGAVLLANCRPYEGTLTVLSSGAVLLWWMRREKQPLTVLWDRRVLLPVAAIAVPVLLAMGYYNYRTTGKATQFPYILNDKTYGVVPFLYILPLPPMPATHHESMRKASLEYERPFYYAARHNPLAPWISSAPLIKPFYLMNLLGLAASAGLLFGKRSVVLPALGILSLPMLGLMMEKAFLPHYVAPMCGAWVILAGAAMEACGERGRAGRLVVVTVLAVAIGSCAAGIFGAARIASQKPSDIDARPRLIADLQRQGGRHLIIVRYTPAHYVHEDWVYNDADIDGSRVVWARDMGVEKNRELLAYFKDRRIWLFEPDSSLALKPYL